MVLARLSVLPLAIVEWLFVLWLARNVGRFSRTWLSRRLAQILFVACIVGTVMAQIAIYARVSHARRIDDPFLMFVIALESLIGAGIFLYVLMTDRSK